MCITEYAEARLEFHRTRPKSNKCSYSLSMEPGRDLLNTRYDEVLRIMKWFIERKRSRASVALVGGEEELIREALYVLLRTKPKTEISLTTRVCHCVIWAHGKMIYNLHRRTGINMVRLSPKPIAAEDTGFADVDAMDLNSDFWRKCARLVKSDRCFRILYRWWHDDTDQTVMAEEQGVTRQMISLLMKKAEARLRAKRNELEECESLVFGRRW